jgi:putative colanic acid biosynthesis acetyltransferase WcaF
MDFGTFKSNLRQWFMNYFVTYIPCWTIRKFFLRLCGVSIGMGSRILMGCKFEGPKGICIGANTHINSNCHIDGRGGLTIGDNCNISNYSMIVTASHDMKSDKFAYRTGEVVIEDCCWVGTAAIILDRSHLLPETVIGAGSVFKGATDRVGGVYVGVPAKWVKDRKLKGRYVDEWKAYFI